MSEKIPAIFNKVEELPKKRGRGRKGRISGPVIEQFLKTGEEILELRVDRVFPGRSVQSIYATLRGYCQAHPELGVEVFLANGSLYLMRTVQKDDEEGTDRTSNG